MGSSYEKEPTYLPSRAKAELEIRGYCPVIVRFFDSDNNIIDLTFIGFEEDSSAMIDLAKLVSKAFGAVDFSCVYQGVLSESVSSVDVIFIILDNKIKAYSLDDIDGFKDLFNDLGRMVDDSWDLISNNLDKEDRIEAKLDLLDIGIDLLEAVNGFIIIEKERI